MRIIPEFLTTQFEDDIKSPGLSKQSLVSPRSRQKPCTILVIDDDASLQRLIQQTLASGATVLQEFDSNSEYIASLDFEGVDAVVLDYKMPGEDGLSILRKIRTKYSQLPVLFMTGFGDLDIAKEALAAGANEYFPKPFHPNDLRAVVSKWVPTFEIPHTRGTSPAAPAEQTPLHDVTEIENFLTARDHTGNEFRARVVRYNSRSVVVETTLDKNFEIGTPLEETCITLGHRSMEVVSALVLLITELAERQLVEITLPGVWQIEGFKEGTDPEEVAKIIRSREKSPTPVYSRFDQGSIERKIIPESYRTTISDVEHILQEFYDDLEPFEKFLHQVSTGERTEIERRMIEYAEGRFFPALTGAMNKFEKAAHQAEKDGISEEFGKFAKKRLYPLMLCSPFLSRVISKPIGVPGDYGILGQLLGHPYEGHSLYGRMLNAWAITANPSAAYRHRINLLGDAINDAVEKAAKEGRRARILSMASGVAYEVQRFVSKPVEGPKVDFELVDFSNRTLHEAKKQFSACQKIHDPNGIDVKLKHGSVVDLAKQTKLSLSEEEMARYDLVYCAGLFDYLSGRMCSNIVSYLYDLAKPGGKVIVSNYTPENALRYFMGVVLDWELIHRTPQEFHALMQTTSARENYTIVEDDTRTELYAIADKV